MLASAHFNGPYKKQLRRGKKLYYSHQCQLVWHAAVSSIHLPIQKKHLIIVISPCLERETFPDMWPGHAEVSQTWARGRKRPQMPHVLHSFTCTFKQRHVYSTVVDLTPPTPRLFLLEPSSLIKSISCASAVPRQMTFKQLLLFGEQMGVRAEIV